jgi:phage shock protein A
MEDPNATLDLSYEKMLTGLQETKRHLADVLAEQKLLERQMDGARKDADKAQDDARLALQANREDLAKASLNARQSALQKLDTLQHAHDTIAPQAAKLVEYERKLEERITQFRTQKEVMKSSYSAAQAQVKVTESLAGVGHDLGSVGDSLQRAEDKVAGMRAKADAMDGMLQTGILNDPLDRRSGTERELDALRSSSAVDTELERLKAELAGKPPV